MPDPVILGVVALLSGFSGLMTGAWILGSEPEEPEPDRLPSDRWDRYGRYQWCHTNQEGERWIR